MNFENIFRKIVISFVSAILITFIVTVLLDYFVQPIVDNISVERNQVSIDFPKWNIKLDAIISEVQPLISDIVNIPNDHFKDVRENHQHPGLLPTIDSNGDMIQRTPCVRVNLIYPDGQMKVTCVSSEIYHSK